MAIAKVAPAPEGEGFSEKSDAVNTKDCNGFPKWGICHTFADRLHGEGS
jgi:hypothetical protein